MSNVPFDFIVDKEALTISARAELTAGIDSVWNAYTKPEIRDLWWGPKPWRSQTRHMNFEVGGRRVYCMIGPAGEEFWSLEEFTSISPKTSFEMNTSFIDRDENIDPDYPSSSWKLDFNEKAGITTVTISIQYATISVLEKMIEMGFKEGSTIVYNQLQELLTESE